MASAQQISALAAVNCASPEVVSAGYHEPSLVFLVGTSIRLTDGTGAAEFLKRGACRVAFVESRQERAFVQRAEAIGLLYSAGPRIEGFNINGGHAITVSMFRSENTR